MIKAYFPTIEEVPDSTFKITPEIEEKLKAWKQPEKFETVGFPDDWKACIEIPEPPEKFETSERQNSVDTGDNVNHPKHYTEHPSGVECIQVTEHMTFNCGNAVKYIWRNGLKDGNSNIQDLNKSIWYLQREIERLSKK